MTKSREESVISLLVEFELLGVSILCETILFAFGFHDCGALARKLTDAFTACSRVLQQVRACVHLTRLICLRSLRSELTAHPRCAVLFVCKHAAQTRRLSISPLRVAARLVYRTESARAGRLLCAQRAGSGGVGDVACVPASGGRGRRLRRAGVRRVAHLRTRRGPADGRLLRLLGRKC